MGSHLLRQIEQETAVHERRPFELPAGRRQPDATREAPLRDLQTHDFRSSCRRRQPPHPGDKQDVRLGRNLDILRYPRREERRRSASRAHFRRRRSEAPNSRREQPQNPVGRTGGAFAPPARSWRRLPPTSSFWDRPRSSNMPHDGRCRRGMAHPFQMDRRLRKFKCADTTGPPLASGCNSTAGDQTGEGGTGAACRSIAMTSVL